MARTGQPYQSSDVIPYGEASRRLRPPDSLSDAAKKHFIDLITTSHSRQFTPADLPLLCRWAELCALAERAEFELATTGPVLPDGKLSAWFSAHQQATKALSGLALRLRIGPQSRQAKQSKKTVDAVSYYDEMRLQKDWDQP